MLLSGEVAAVCALAASLAVVSSVLSAAARLCPTCVLCGIGARSADEGLGTWAAAAARLAGVAVLLRGISAAAVASGGRRAAFFFAAPARDGVLTPAVGMSSTSGAAPVCTEDVAAG